MPLRDDLQTALGPAYTLGEELGGGGMSQLFVAREAALDREVVVKVLPPELADAVSAERFALEAAVLARLRHPHIVPILSAGSGNGLLWYIMPLVRGESLRARLEREGRLPLAEAVTLIREAAGAVAWAHAQGVIHRDIKPANILFEAGHAVLADFGIARAVGNAARDRLTATGLAVGTVGYMAPEQLAGETGVDASADQYALGAVAYELLTGRAVFEASSPQALLAAHVRDVPTAPHEVIPDLPEAVGEVVLRALAKEPADRYTSVEAFSHALGEAYRRSVRTTTSFRVPAGATTSTGARAAPSSANRRGLAAVLGAGAVALALWLALGGRATSSPDASDAVDAADLLAVAPFDIIAPEATLLREGMVDLLARHFDGMGPLQTVAPSRSIRAWSAARADVASAQEHGRALGAGLVIVGTITPAGRDSVRALVQLVDVAAGRAIAEADRQEALDRVDRLADSVTLTLVTGLSARRPGLAMRTTALGSRDVGAVRAFLRGESLFRAALYDSAAQAFTEARTRDSTFALAWMRGVEANGFAGGEAGFGAISSADRAAALRIVPGATHGLSPRDSALLMAWVAYERSNGFVGAIGQGAAVHEALEASADYLARFPDDPSLLMMRGEIQFHLGFAFPGTTARVTAETFDRAVRADSGFLVAYEHLLELAPVVWGVERQRALAQAYLARARDPVRRQAMAALVALAAEPAAAAALLDSLPTPVLRALVPKLAYWFDREGASVTAMRVLNARLERETGRPAPLAFSVATRDAARGRLGGIPALSSPLSYVLLMDPAVEGYLPAALTDSLTGAWERRLNGGANFYDYPPAVIAAHLHGVRGDRVRFEATRGFLLDAVEMAKREGRWGAIPLPADMRAMYPQLERLTLATVEPLTRLVSGDTAGVLRAIDSLPVSLLPAPASIENRIYARLLASAGRLNEAIDLLGAVPPVGVFGFVADHALRGRLAERAGRPELARESWEIVAAAWQDADPELQPVVQEARAALARLGPPPPDAGGRRVGVPR